MPYFMENTKKKNPRIIVLFLGGPILTYLSVVALFMGSSNLYWLAQRTGKRHSDNRWLIINFCLKRHKFEASKKTVELW